MANWYSQVWGLQTGDVLTAPGASVDLVVLMVSSPYYVAEFATSICIRKWPVVTVECARKRRSLDPDRTVLVCDIRRIGSRYFTDQNAPVLVEKPPGDDLVKRLRRNVTAWPGDLERMVENLGDNRVSDPEPYPFDAAVDYSIPRQVWKCNSCHQDFNAPFRIEYIQNSINRRKIGPCPRCQEDVGRRFLTPYNLIFVLESRPDPNTGAFSPFGEGWVSNSGVHCPPTCEEANAFHSNRWDQLLPGHTLPWESYPIRQRRPW
jgi:hypothetical protein